ncbi:hypothetical protein [Ferribacterium limneticum]|uniref:hypothetical protein n=1 Tax=Ferribacterium limneticum TaxID=76259 RepID=UPI001CFB2E54|nr:hypothetical protein [Ferribacterium limneticum]UCV29342.1 hypothetical protein KI617_04380 [Ferribacterium limneticum]UCV33261.1 hypothetical protein KI608_04380 [Ferribacterium limneticum]
MKTIKALAAIAIVLPTLAFAQANTPRVDQRQANQEQRIDQGVASGSLTQREANRMERGQQHVDNMENRAKSDGVVTRQERARLHQAQDVQSKRIYRQKHDRQHDYNHNGRVDRPRHR